MKKSAKILSVLLALLLLLAAIPAFVLTTSAEDQPVTLTAQSVSGVRGDTVTVPVRISGVTTRGINGFQIRVTYDPVMLRAESASINRPGDYKVVNYGEGFVEFMWTSLNANKKNNEIVSVTFTLLKAGDSEVTPVFDASKGDCVYYIDGEDFVDLPCETVAGTVHAEVDPETDFCYILTAPDTPLNQQAIVNITMRNAEAVYGFSLEVNFDPAKLAFDKGTFSAYFPYARAVCLEAGKVRVFGATDYPANITGDAPMVDLAFDIIDPDKAEGSAYDLTISFYNRQPAYTRVDHQTVNITDVGCINATLTLLAAVEQQYDPADLNRDGVVDISDVSALLNLLGGTSGAIAADADADLSGDGVADIGDVTELLNRLS